MRLESRVRLALGILSVIAAGPGPAIGADGGEPIASVLNVAVPRRLVDAQSAWPDALADILEKASADRGLQIHLAIGSDYEILDWLGKGLVDAGVIPSLSLYLLRDRDKIDLVEIGPRPAPPDALPSRPRSRHLVSGTWRDGADPRGDFDAARDWIWCRVVRAEVDGVRAAVVDGERRRCRERRDAAEVSWELVLPSHLSTFGFLLPVAETAQWLGERPLLASAATTAAERKALTDRFWQELFANTRFTLGGPSPDTRSGRTAAVFFEDQRPARRPGARASLSDLSPDHLVIRRATAVALPASPQGMAARRARVTLPEALRKTFASENRAEVPVAFRSLLFSEPSFGARTFDFTVDESIELLRQRREGAGPARLALVLPGGGVKAAYQSRLVEYLYAEGRLRNARTSPGPGSQALPVDYVIGTSGGALLGFFVARLAENGPWRLSELLWKMCSDADGHCRDLRSTDIFGFVDMPRYFTFLVAFLVLWSLLTIRNFMAGEATADPATRSTRRVWRLRLTLAMGPILLLTPILIRYVNEKVAREHIPEIEGVFYAAFAVVAMFVDQCVIRDDSRVDLVAARWRILGAGLTPVGLALVAVSILAKTSGQADLWPDLVFGSWSIHLNSLLACTGALLLLLGATLWAYASTPHYLLTGVRGFLTGVGLALTHILLVYLVLYAVVTLRPGWLSFLELTVQFWLWLIAVSAVVGLAILVLDRATRPRGQSGSRWLSIVHDGIRYLSAYHPNGDLAPRRALRLLLAAWLAVVWWNFVVAPALYGNGPAQTFMRVVVGQFDRAFESANHRSSAGLTASLIVPANDLEKSRTSYFLFAPDAGDCPSLVRRPGDDATWRSFRVPPDSRPEGTSEKDIVDCEDGRSSSRDDFRRVVFASGSPFPVFPAHQVGAQRLVDGGYSNLVPVDAAQTVSAQAVLIVGSSSPLAPDSAAPGWLSRIPGELVTSSPRILAFLYERSQQVDRLSRPDLLVVSIAPRREEPNWPLLTDFRPSVVERMIRTAELDLSRRVGLVQSWGRPRFARSVPAAVSARPGG